MIKNLRPRPAPKASSMNPVARAIARQKLQSRLFTLTILFFFADEGAPLQDVVQEVSRLIVVTMLACKIDDLHEHTVIMDKALRQLCAIAESEFKWVRQHAWVVEAALEEVMIVTPKLSTVAVVEATKEIRRLELLEKQNAATSNA